MPLDNNFPIEYDGLLDPIIATFKQTGLTRGNPYNVPAIPSDLGKPVRVSADSTVALCTADEIPDGFLETIDNANIGNYQICGVKLGGIHTAEYEGTITGVGVKKIATATLNGTTGNLRIKDVGGGTGRRVLVLSNDTTDKMLTFVFYPGGGYD